MSASLKTLQQSVSSRDSEILRLHRLLDGGRPEAAVDAAAADASVLQEIHHSFPAVKPKVFTNQSPARARGRRLRFGALSLGENFIDFKSL